ncbi:single-stranded DNA-binding protein [Nocardioides albus]|uniref:Single-stranded DNA-binding protein n=1 Tax=Nocardioides albus TaxID=1841 RepID=A0A7W5AAD7_9ACTN|nr:single-stranded DNA-binding protein [Nocardioides albus]MBB3092189.1 single-strand DNA-binding protein [Nocardioides albus]GGU46436.1 single-stranded DNA-binding protein [Nocardioides albus]
MNTITFAGNLTEDPELRFTPSGTPVANLRVAVNRRVKQNNGEWVDATPTFHNIKVWGRQAENLAESLFRGDRALVHGQIETESWADKDTGELRTKDVVVISDRYGEIGPSIRYATARPEKVSRKSPTGAEVAGDQDEPDNVRHLATTGPKPTEPPF